MPVESTRVDTPELAAVATRHERSSIDDDFDVRTWLKRKAGEVRQRDHTALVVEVFLSKDTC